MAKSVNVGHCTKRRCCLFGEVLRSEHSRREAGLGWGSLFKLTVPIAATRDARWLYLQHFVVPAGPLGER